VSERALAWCVWGRGWVAEVDAPLEGDAPGEDSPVCGVCVCVCVCVCACVKRVYTYAYMRVRAYTRAYVFAKKRESD